MVESQACLVVGDVWAVAEKALVREDGADLLVIGYFFGSCGKDQAAKKNELDHNKNGRELVQINERNGRFLQLHGKILRLVTVHRHW